MAKRKKSRRKNRRSARRTTKRRTYVAATPKRKRARSKKRIGATPKRKTPRRIGATSMNTKKMMRNALAGAKVGAGAKLASYGAAYLPIANPWLKNGALYLGGVIVEGFLPDVGLGIAGKGVERMLDQVLPTPAASVRGIGRRRSTMREVDMIENAALTDRLNGVTEQTVVGNPIMEGDML